ncbi:MAG: capsular biosynthesis protein [Lachnospiraceae bacterium]|nr:capsular biosynthesis protein [Lachnospiraceae bacterium]
MAKTERAIYIEGREKSPFFFFYRDWGLMRYWFRGVERYFPWIRTIHFITWGHVPLWLNVNHPRLHIVRHEDFIPYEFCPTFSVNPIELNLHRVEGLSERFIYANDDMFFVGSIASNYYFQDGLPCDCLCLSPITEACMDGFGHILWNNIACINRHFTMERCMEEHGEKWFTSEYPPEVLSRNKMGEQLQCFPGFRNEHLPIPFLKRTFEEVWEKENTLLRQTCGHRFRSIEDVSDWLMRYWQLAKGDFVPRTPVGTVIPISAPEEKLRDTLLNPQYPIICLNDGDGEVDYAERSAYLRSLFEIILPEMSSFENY